MKKIFSMIALMLMTAVGAMAQTTYNVTVKDGTEDATNWTISPTSAAAGETVTVTYKGTKKVKSIKAVKKAAALTYPIALSAVTADYLGSVVTTDGNVYATADDATAASKTAVAMIAYVDGTSGLAIALADEGGYESWATAKSKCEGKAGVNGGSWRLPTMDQWKAMFKGNDTDGYTYTDLNTALATAGGDGSKLQNYGYWSSTEGGSGAFYVSLYGDGEASFNNDIKSFGYLVRACLAFTCGESAAASGIDLSMVDCAGNARAEGKMWTANCYMVHTAGDYKLPLVYGNAIKNGATNSAAYTGVTSAVATATFPRHDGSPITDPWIKDNGITVTSAELLWQDASGLITEVGIDGDYLTLTVGKDATAQEGNAVIAAKDGSGNIVWSWHIWVTNQDFATLTTIATGDHNYQVTPVNLGWVATGGEGKQGYNTFYQWGRKDAFKGTGAPADANVYNISGTEVTGFTYTESTTAEIKDNIKNPTTHYYNVDTYGPCTDTYYNMWDAQNTETGNVTTATMKTVYDPCPPGFCVPTGNLYKYASDQYGSTTWDGTNKGHTWSGIFFPASGYRNNSSGTLDDVGSYGYCWSASPYSSNNGRNLYFHSRNWDWASNSRAKGFPVRAVAEE